MYAHDGKDTRDIVGNKICVYGWYDMHTAAAQRCIARRYEGSQGSYAHHASDTWESVGSKLCVHGWYDMCVVFAVQFSH